MCSPAWAQGESPPQVHGPAGSEPGAEPTRSFAASRLPPRQGAWGPARPDGLGQSSMALCDPGGIPRAP